MKPLFQRFCAQNVQTAMSDTRVVMINGPRQCGKTTLAREFEKAGRVYLTLDDDTILQAARADPVSFVRNLDSCILDEVQRAPDLMRAIKVSVDNDRRPGRFLLTGSSNILTLPQISESLAGRMEVVTLMPLARAEILGKKPRFLDDAIAGKVSRPHTVTTGNDLVRAVLTGGYPEMVRRTEPRRRRAWAQDYVKAMIARDVRDIATIEKLDQMPRLLRVLAHHSGWLTNFAQVGGQLGMDDKTTKKYAGILEQLFLLQQVGPWFRNRVKRLVKTPKLYFLDSGLLATLLGVTSERVARDRSLFGPVLETFAFAEIIKQATWLEESCTFYHYRDKDLDEVDVVAETGAGAVVGFEIKASATVRAGDFKGLRKLAQACRGDLQLGAVLYDGENVVPFGDRLFAVPISCLWN
jgi:predicted AAA+ superfamily ATPase